MNSIDFIMTVGLATLLTLVRLLLGRAGGAVPSCWPTIQLEALSVIWNAERARAECVGEFLPDYDFMRRNPRFAETAAQLKTLMDDKLERLDHETAESMIEL